MEEKVSVEAEVPYVFQTGHMCLIARFTVGTKGQLLNIVQQFEEEEDEGKTMDIWNVYVLHIYLLILLQVLCKWIAGMVNDEERLSGETIWKLKIGMKMMREVATMNLLYIRGRKLWKFFILLGK